MNTYTLFDKFGYRVVDISASSYSEAKSIAAKDFKLVGGSVKQSRTGRLPDVPDGDPVDYSG